MPSGLTRSRRRIGRPTVYAFTGDLHQGAAGEAQQVLVGLLVHHRLLLERWAVAHWAGAVPVVQRPGRSAARAERRSSSAASRRSVSAIARSARHSAALPSTARRPQR